MKKPTINFSIEAAEIHPSDIQQVKEWGRHALPKNFGAGVLRDTPRRSEEPMELARERRGIPRSTEDTLQPAWNIFEPISTTLNPERRSR